MIFCPECNIGIDYRQVTARYCNNCGHEWETYHVLPNNDLKKHTESYLCKCEPRVEYESGNIIVIHNSYDGREGVEWANEILNMGRDYTKFFTPPETAKFMAELLDPKEGDAVLEPSAGNGALVKAVKIKCPDCIVFAFELDKQWEDDLRGIDTKMIVVIKDFLEIPVYAKFTSCIANPPFGNGTDLQAHFDRIREHVKKGGKIVMIVPDDFEPGIEHNYYPLKNWGINKDGTVTLIKIIEFLN